MPELLETFEYTGDRTAVANWAAGLRGEWQPFDWSGPDGELCLTAGAQEDMRVKPGEHIAAIKGDPDVWVPTGVRLVRAGAWVYGHNLAGYLPESDVMAFADWPDAKAGFEEMLTQYCQADDETAMDIAEDARARLFDEDDTTDDRVPEFPDSADMMERASNLLAGTPMVEGKGYAVQLPDHRGRVIELWLKWEKTALPSELIEA